MENNEENQNNHKNENNGSLSNDNNQPVANPLEQHQIIQNNNINDICAENNNLRFNNNIKPNSNINPAMENSSYATNIQPNIYTNLNISNDPNIQLNNQSQPILIQYPQNQMSNQEINVNNYIINCYPPDQMDQMEQMQYQQQIDQTSNKNIYDYDTNKTLYGIAFQNGSIPRLAISSLEKSIKNKIEILELIDNDLKNVYELQVGYPCTKILWSPKNSKSKNLLATSTDCIELYDFSELNHKLNAKDRLFNKKSKYCGALTSFDWNPVNDAILGTASLDTTCTIWDLNKSSIKTQLIAHDKEVFDIQFGNDENTFISGGADGSVRLFDLRELNHSTIIYETKGGTPINKLAWNLQTSNLIAALSLDKNIIYIFDSRANSNVSMDELNLHKAPVTGIVWAPDNPSQLCSVSEDNNVIISSVHNDQLAQNSNVSYNAPFAINNVDWCKNFPEWIGITFQNRVQLLRK